MQISRVKLKVEITKEVHQIYFSSGFSVAAIFCTIKYSLFHDNILSSTDSNVLKHLSPSTLNIIIFMTQLDLKIV